MKSQTPHPNFSKAEYGSDAIVDLLKALDIEYIAMNPGASFRELHDSIVNYGGSLRLKVVNHRPARQMVLFEDNEESTSPNQPT